MTKQGTEGTEVCVQLPEMLTIATVASTYSELSEAIAGPSSRLRLDAGQVQRVDMAGVQLLRALTLAMFDQRLDCEIENVPSGLREACRDAGWQSILGNEQTSEEVTS